MNLRGIGFNYIPSLGDHWHLLHLGRDLHERSPESWWRNHGSIATELGTKLAHIPIFLAFHTDGKVVEAFSGNAPDQIPFIILSVHLKVDDAAVYNMVCHYMTSCAEEY